MYGDIGFHSGTQLGGRIADPNKYPDRCKQEQDHLGQFTKFGLAGEQTGNEDNASDSSHALEFQFGMKCKNSHQCALNGGSIISPLDVRSSGGTSG